MMIKTACKILLFMLLFCVTLWSQQNQSPPGFEDANQDGINDRFADANGDGVNDVDGKPYPHSFKFKDENNDGMNDLWADADGDGVNDLLNIQKQQNAWVDMDGDGIQDEGGSMIRGKGLRLHVLDVNQDGMNDITGERISNESAGGSRYGQVNEEAGIRDRGFVDTDGDGKNDHFSGGEQTERETGRTMDVFIDEDGDGIADERGLERSQEKQRGKSKQ